MPNQKIPAINPEDVKLLAKTAWGEARGEKDPNSILGVMYSIKNRQSGRNRGQSLLNIVMEPYQYKAWDPIDPNRKVIDAFDESHPQYELFAQRARDVLGGVAPDPTGGAEYYVADKVLKSPKRPKWLDNLNQTGQFGNHVFFKSK